MLKHTTVSSQIFLKTNRQQIKNNENESFSSETMSSLMNMVEKPFLSQAVVSMARSLPLWSISWTRPFQMYEVIFANKAMGLVSILGPLSQHSTLPSQIAQDWKIRKNVHQSLIRYGTYSYKDKKIKNNENHNIFIHCKKHNYCLKNTFVLFDSLIETKSFLTLSKKKKWHKQMTLPGKFDLPTTDTRFKIRILYNKMALKISQLSEKCYHSSTKMNYLYQNQKRPFEAHIDFLRLNTKARKIIEKPYKTNLKQTNTSFFNIVCADCKNVNNQDDIRQFIKHKNLNDFQRKKKIINGFKNKHSAIDLKKVEKKDINFHQLESQWIKKFYKHIRETIKIRDNDLFYGWKECLVKQKRLNWLQTDYDQYWIDHQTLLIFSHLLYKILSLRVHAYYSLILTSPFQLISIELWWALFISCGMGLISQYNNTLRQGLRRAVSLSPLSIWHLYWNQKPTHKFWPQVIKSLQLRAINWAQPRFIQIQNVFRTGISPLVTLSVKPRLINSLSFKIAHRVLNIVDSIENLIELAYDKIILLSINLHTRTNCILIKQLDQAYDLSRRLWPSFDNILVIILSNPIAQFVLFLLKYFFYSTIWWALVPFRLIGFFYSLGWRLWYIMPISIKLYVENRGRERRFQSTLERALTYQGMLAGAHHVLDHPDIGIYVAKRIRMLSLFLRMSNICNAELSAIAGIDTCYDASIRDTLLPKSSLLIEPIGSRRYEWFQLASDHWRLPLIQLKLDWSPSKDEMSMSGKDISIRLGFRQNLAEKRVSLQKKLSKSGQGTQSGGATHSGGATTAKGSLTEDLNRLFQIIREDDILADGAIAPSMERPQTIAEDYIIRHFMIAGAAIPCLFVVESLNSFYDKEETYSYLAARELRERASMGGLCYEEKMFGFLPKTGYLTVDYWDILGMPNQLEKEAEEEDYEIEELEDDPPEIREAKLALKKNLGQQEIYEFVTVPKEGGITGWEIMKLFSLDQWNSTGTLLYLLWLLDKFPRTRYGIRFGIGTLLTIKEPLLRKRRWDKVYTMRGLNWVDRERILQVLMTRTGALRLKEQALQEVLPRSRGYNSAEMHSFTNEMALCKAQASLHLQWGKEWAWEDALLKTKVNKNNKLISGVDAAPNFLVWKKAVYLQDLYNATPNWACVEKALRFFMRKEQASMTHLAMQYFFRDGRAHIHRHLSKWMVNALLFPGITKFPAYNAGETRFRYGYLEQFAGEEPFCFFDYRRDPTGTAAWAEIIRSFALIIGGDLYYEGVENPSQQKIFETDILADRLSLYRGIRQTENPIIYICWQLLWALAKQNPLIYFQTNFTTITTNVKYNLDSLKEQIFRKEIIKNKNFYINKSYSKLLLKNEIVSAQAREEDTLPFSKDLLFRLIRFPGLDKEDILGEEPFINKRFLSPYSDWRAKRKYHEDLGPIRLRSLSSQLMRKDEELLHLNYLWEPFIFSVNSMPRYHIFQQEKQKNPDEYGRPLEAAELREVEDRKTGAAILVSAGANPTNNGAADLEQGELIVNLFLNDDYEDYEDIQLFATEEKDGDWHLNPSHPRVISINDLHFLHGWMPFFQWIHKEELDPIYTQVWVAPYRRLHVLATYVDSYVIDDLPSIHQRLFGLDPTDPDPEATWDIKMENLKKNKWKADDRGRDQFWLNLEKNPEQAKLVLPLLEQDMEFFTMPEWIRSREHRRKIRMKERTRKRLSNAFDRADPHTGSIDDPAVLAVEPLLVAVAQQTELVITGMLLMAHECGPFWRSYRAVATGMHRGWDLTYSITDLRWLFFNEIDQSQSWFYSTLYEIEKMMTWFIGLTWPHLQNVFCLMQSRTAWAQQEIEKSNWRLTELSYSAKLQRAKTVSRLETEEINSISWTSIANTLSIQPFLSSFFSNFFHIQNDKISNQVNNNKKQTQTNSIFHSSEVAEICAYKKPGWWKEKLVLIAEDKPNLKRYNKNIFYKA
uniref:hypothetical protein n=1 Tax=Klebsormidium crenulatum TaxID=424406 RepID=UPI00286C4A2B|nr:hypothetical protein RMD54_pgp070 [Klebsormidium crenulatum]WKT06348.1 hypothetical protein [Klebsormidium crenulatum]